MYFLVRDKCFACEITSESAFYMLHFYAFTLTCLHFYITHVSFVYFTCAEYSHDIETWSSQNFIISYMILYMNFTFFVSQKEKLIA